MHSEWIGRQLAQCAEHKHRWEPMCPKLKCCRATENWKHTRFDITRMYATYQMSLWNLCSANLNLIRDYFPLAEILLSQYFFFWPTAVASFSGKNNFSLNSCVVSQKAVMSRKTLIWIQRRDKSRVWHKIVWGMNDVRNVCQSACVSCSVGHSWNDSLLSLSS